MAMRMPPSRSRPPAFASRAGTAGRIEAPRITIDERAKSSARESKTDDIPTALAPRILTAVQAASTRPPTIVGARPSPQGRKQSRQVKGEERRIDRHVEDAGDQR